MATQTLVRPAASEVRSMLNRIKMENIERSALTLTQSVPKASKFATRAIAPTFVKYLPSEWRGYPTALKEMGSFTSTPKALPATSADATDDDVYYPKTREDLNRFLQRCSQQLQGLPHPIQRRWRKTPKFFGENGLISSNPLGPINQQGENIRVFQWNVLSQSLGTKNDNFVRCPSAALNWPTRRFRMLEEIARHDADVICLQEVDHFKFLQNSLASLGYVGHFLPKPDSPCLYLPDNSGPDGCAIFYKEDKFDLRNIDSRIIEVWRVQSNQVLLSLVLRSKKSQEEFVVSTTHLKARNGALLSSLRNEQGRDLVEHLSQFSAGRPVICTGDFNAEPTEPVYATMTHTDELRLSSAYAAAFDGKEPKYTTWKIREDGEHIEILDYVFYSHDKFQVASVLDLPTGEQIGFDRLPSLAFASDHFSLVTDLKLLSSSKPDIKNQEKLV